jgi:hypothetical protein
MLDSSWAEYWDYTDSLPSSSTDLSKIFFYDNFEGGVNGQPLQEYNSAYGSAGDSIIDSSDSYNGTRCMQTNLAKGYRGFNSWGFTVKFPAVYEGDEVWIRAAVKMRPDTDTSTGITHLKFIRLLGEAQFEDGSYKNCGYLECGLRAGEPPTAIRNHINAERPVGDVSTSYKPWDPPHDYTEWRMIEFYAKMGVDEMDNGGNAVVRVWMDGNLVREDKATQKTTPHYRDPDDRSIKEWPKNGRRNNLYMTTYWNGGQNDGSGLYPTTDIRWWYDHVTIAVKNADRDDSAHLATDAYGNKFIGMAINS